MSIPIGTRVEDAEEPGEWGSVVEPTAEELEHAQRWKCLDEIMVQWDANRDRFWHHPSELIVPESDGAENGATSPTFSDGLHSSREPRSTR